MDLKNKAKNLPTSPGVYLMKDSIDRIIYVGKAKNLKNRVRTYFQNSKSHSQKIVKLKANIKDFDFILTDTEFEAFMLENNLIKSKKPLFNKQMKSPQSYTYIVIRQHNENRRIETADQLEKDGNLYFGPFTSKGIVEKALLAIKEIYKIDCSNPASKNTPCLNYSLGLCIGICKGGQAIEHYNKILDKIINLLNGTDKRILKEIKQKMLAAAEKLDYKTAAKYKEQLNTISSVIKKEKVIEFTEANKNIVILEYLTEDAFKLFLIKGNKVLFSKKYNKENANMDELVEEIQGNILTYFKVNSQKSIAVSKEELDEAQIIYRYLKGSNSTHAIISQDWLEIHNDKIDEALNKLFINN